MLEFLMKHDVERTEETERYFIEYQPCFALAADQKLMESVLQPKVTKRTNVLSGGGYCEEQRLSEIQRV